MAFDFNLSKLGLMSQTSICWENQLSVIRTLVVAFFFLGVGLVMWGCQSEDRCIADESQPDSCWCPGYKGRSCDIVDESFGASWMQWLGDNASGWTELRLRDIALPGTHDAASGYLERSGSNIRIDGSRSGNDLVVNFPELASGWAKTQENSLIEQLHAGVRFFDLRMVLNIGGGATFHHGDVHWDTEAMPVFEEFRDFLLTHSREVVVFSMTHFVGGANTEVGHRRFAEKLYSIFGDLLIPASMNAPGRTMEEILSTKGRLVVFYQRSNGEGFWEDASSSYLYPIERISSKYDVRVNTGPKLDEHLDLEAVEPVEDLKVIQAHLQYSQEIIQNDLTSSIERYTIEEAANERVLAWLQRSRENPRAFIRIVQLDYYELMARDLLEELANINRATSRRRASMDDCALPD